MAHRQTHNALHVLRRAAAPLPNPIPNSLDHLIHNHNTWVSTVARRGASDSSQCTDNDSSAQCEKPSQSNNITLPVVLGVV